MKKLLLSTFLFLTAFTFVLQAQNSIWSLPPNYISYTPNPQIQSLPIPPGATPPFYQLGYYGQAAVYSHNALQDAGGNLLFFIVDDLIFDKAGNFIGDLSATTQGDGGTETMIVPDPNNCQRYYIFTSDELNPGKYSILDFSNMIPSPVNPLTLLPTLTTWEVYCSVQLPQKPCWDLHNPIVSDVINHPQQLNIAGNQWSLLTHTGPSGSKGYLTYAASKVNANNKRFIYMQLNEAIIVFEIGGPFLKAIDFYSLPFANTDFGRGEMELVELANGNFRLAFSYYRSKTQQIPKTPGVFYVDINPTTGIPISGTENIYDYDDPLAYIHGIEFSLDGNYLYITHDKTTTTPSVIDVYQIGSPAPVPLTSLNATVTNEDDFANSEIELNIENGVEKLYLYGNNTSNTNGRLATFSNPNTPGSGLWNNSALSVNYNFNYAGNVSNQTKTYLLPDQIDGMDYTAHFTANIQCCKDNSPYDVSVIDNNYEFTGTQTWSGTGTNPWGWVNTSTIGVTVKDKLIIKTGANITINNMRFEFAPEAQLIIENGARLTIDGTTLTADTRCDINAMWHGVEVWGNGASQPFTSGRFRAINNSVIEHAMVATANFQHQQDANNKPIINTTVTGFNGGVIQAENTTFHNNYIDTKFETFFSTFNNDQSRFVECHFVTDAHLNNPNLDPYAHADLNKVRGLRFNACVFEVTLVGLTAYPNIAQRGFGILAYETLFSVSNKCSIITQYPNPCPLANSTPSEFNNLYVGILANGGTMPSQTAKVNNSKFYNNYGGMYFQNLLLSEVVNNEIFVANNINSIIVSFGLYLQNSDKYKVEDNTFSTATGYYGAYINNSGTGANEIYRNSFENFTVATQAANINGDGQSAGNGLEFKCNKYQNTSDYDILISSGLIKAFHGKCGTILNPNDPTTPSNNEFSYTAQFGDFWMTNNTTPPGFNVSYQMAQDPNSFQTIPRDYPNNATHYNQLNTNPTFCTGITYDPNISCPKRVGKTVVILSQLIAANKVLIDNLQAQIDGGNTQSLITTINTQPAWKVRNDLMTASPNLSDEVLLALLNSNMPDWIHQQVLNANAPLSDKVFLAALNKTPVLPENIIRDIAIASSPLHTNEQLALLKHSPKYADWVLKEVLLENSPLKDEVLVALIDKTPIIADWAVKEILLKNTPLSIEVTEALNNHIPTYPTWMINQIKNSTYVAAIAIDEPQPNSVVSEINSEINYYQAESDRYRDDILRFYLFDEDGTDAGISDVINYLEVENCPKTSSKCLLTGAYLANEQFANAQTTVNTLSNDTVNTNYCMLYNSVIQYQQTAEREFALLNNTTLRTPVETVALNNTANVEVGVANTVLSTINNQFIAPVFEFVTLNNNQRLAPIDQQNGVAILNNINIYPNPAKEQFTLTHNLEMQNGVITLSVFDLMGRKLITETINDVKANINTQSLTSGVYFYTITQNNTTIQSDKLMIE